jgi:hypothetical protein
MTCSAVKASFMPACLTANKKKLTKAQLIPEGLTETVEHMSRGV